MPLTTGGAVNFLTVRNSQNILVAIIPVLLLGLGQTFVIIAAGIDLSVGWVMSLGSVLSALALRFAFNRGAPLFPSVVVGLIAGVAGAAMVGLVNGSHHRQAEGPRVHRDARHLVHRARRRLSDVGEHDGDRLAGGLARLRQ